LMTRSIFVTCCTGRSAGLSSSISFGTSGTSNAPPESYGLHWCILWLGAIS
jgi:hypothetical protein